MKKILLSTAVTSSLLISSSFGNSDVNLTNGLIAHYEFENNANDSSGNDNNGTENGVTYKTGQIGQAAYFDGSSSIKVLNFTELDYKKDFSIAFWFNVDSFSEGSQNFFTRELAFEAAVVNGAQPVTSTNTYDNDEAIAKHGLKYAVYEDWDWYSTNYTTILDNWYHYTIIYKASTKSVDSYVNGQLVSSDALGADGFQSGIVSDTYMCIGGRSSTSSTDSCEYSMFNGLLDDMYFYERQLSYNEVSTIYNKGISSDDNSSSSYNNGFSAGIEYCKNYPSECGITMDATYTNGYNDGLDYCKENPSECGFECNTTLTSNITAEKINSLNSGWHLLGTVADINDTSIFNTANTVWKYEDEWKAFSPNSATSSSIKSSGIEPLENISADKGFWISK